LTLLSTQIPAVAALCVGAGLIDTLALIASGLVLNALGALAARCLADRIWAGARGNIALLSGADTQNGIEPLNKQRPQRGGAAYAHGRTLGV
jgi:hypothetical protein